MCGNANEGVNVIFHSKKKSRVISYEFCHFQVVKILKSPFLNIKFGTPLHLSIFLDLISMTKRYKLYNVGKVFKYKNGDFMIWAS